MNRSVSQSSVPYAKIMMGWSDADGSRLEKPMSKTYVEHIRSRNVDSIKRMKPNAGSYGA